MELKVFNQQSHEEAVQSIKRRNRLFEEIREMSERISEKGSALQEVLCVLFQNFLV